MTRATSTPSAFIRAAMVGAGSAARALGQGFSEGRPGCLAKGRPGIRLEGRPVLVLGDQRVSLGPPGGVLGPELGQPAGVAPHRRHGFFTWGGHPVRSTRPPPPHPRAVPVSRPISGRVIASRPTRPPRPFPKPRRAPAPAAPEGEQARVQVTQPEGKQLNPLVKHYGFPSRHRQVTTQPLAEKES